MTEELSEELTSTDHDELSLLYQVSVSDIAFFKQQQWTATSYSLAIVAAILFIAYQLLEKPLPLSAQWILIVLNWAASMGCVFVLARLQGSIRGRRIRLKRIRDKFGAQFNKAWEITKDPDDNHFLLYAIVLISASVLTWLVIAIG